VRGREIAVKEDLRHRQGIRAGIGQDDRPRFTHRPRRLVPEVDVRRPHRRDADALVSSCT